MPAAPAKAPPPPATAPAPLRRERTQPGALRRMWAASVTRGRPGRPTSQLELRWLYAAWLGAFLLKMIGSSWDMSWHFRWLRDDLAPPHLLNSAGTALVVALVAFSSYTGHGVDRKALRLLQWGIGLFLAAVPVDLVNHRVNGLDITSWSPSHALLYLGTAVLLAGAIRGWWLYAAPGRVRDLVCLGLWLCFVENALFPNQHQEYGVMSIRAIDAGRPTAEPELLGFAAAQGASPLEFALPVPSWVHPAWLVCAGLLALVLARKVVGLRGTATVLAAGYLVYRAAMGLWLAAMGFPPAVLPVVLLVGAVLIDVAVDRGVPGWAAGPVVASAVYAAAWVQDSAGYLPPWNWASVLLVAAGFGLLWAAVDALARSAWLARWQEAHEPAGSSAPAREPGADRRMT